MKPSSIIPCNPESFQTIKNFIDNVEIKACEDGSINENLHRLIDISSNRTFTIDELTIKMLQDLFSDCRHTIAIDVRYRYFTPFVLDFDCIECNTRGMQCEDPINFMSLGVYINRVDGTVKKLLNSSNVEHVVYKNPKNCNFHVYYNVNVSKFLYTRLYQEIQNAIIDYMGTFILDVGISTLLLPFGGKTNDSAYSFFSFSIINVSKFTVVSIHNKCFDYNEVKYSSNQQVDTLFTPIGRFKSKIPVKQSQSVSDIGNWSFTKLNRKNDYKVIILYTPIELTESSLVETELNKRPKIDYVIKKSAGSFTSDVGDNLLSIYFNDKPTLDTFNFESITDSGGADLVLLDKCKLSSDVKLLLREVACGFATITYQSTETTCFSNDVFKYLVMAMLEFNSGYAFYIICCIYQMYGYIVDDGDQIDSDTSSDKGIVIDDKISNLTFTALFTDLGNKRRASFDEDGPPKSKEPRITAYNELVELTEFLKNLVDLYTCSINAEMLKCNIDGATIDKYYLYFFDNDSPSNATPVVWLNEISTEIRLKYYKNDAASAIIYEKALNLFDRTALMEILALNYSVNKPLLITERGLSKALIYQRDSGLYKAENLLPNQRNVEQKKTYLYGQEFIIKLITKGMLTWDSFQSKNETVLSSNEGNRNSNTLCDEAWLAYLTDPIQTEFKNNYYKNFISTTVGVFNTITGLYMQPIRLIHFNTRKTVCVSPKPNQIEYNASVYRLTRTWLGNINYIFLRTVVYPGLMKLWKSTIVLKNSTDALIENLIIISTDNTLTGLAADKLTQMMKCLIYEYKIEMEDIYTMHQCIEYIIKRKCNITLYAIQKTKSVVEPHDTKQITEFISGGGISLYQMFLSTTLLILDACTDSTIFKSASNRVAQLRSRNNDKTEELNYNARKNFKSALTELGLDMQSTDNVLIYEMLSLSQIMGYDSIKLSDFMTQLSQLYNPTLDRRKVLLMIGSPASGKSWFLNVLNCLHENSHFSPSQTFISKDKGGPDQGQIEAFSKYLISLAEIKEIDGGALKVITGNDVITKRGLYQSSFESLRSFAFLIGASNSNPKITGADEAIKTRLIPFKFTRTFKSTALDDNPIILHINREILIERNFNKNQYSLVLSDLLYAVYKGLNGLPAQCENEESKLLTMDLLCDNNYVYKILRLIGFEVKLDKSIALSELTNVIEEVLQTRADILPQNVNIYTVMSKIKSLFIDKYNEQTNIFVGAGI